MFFDWLRPSDSSSAPRTRRSGTRRRQAKQLHARRRLEVQLLEERRVLATWIGGAAGDWNVAANWDTANVPDGDAVGESAVFNTTAAVNFNVATAFANPIALTFNTGSGATITPAVGATSLRINTLAQADGVNSVATVLSGTAVNVNVDGGALTLSGNNTYSGTVTAQAGVLTLVASPTSNPLGTTELVLSGGTAEVSSSAAPVQGRFVQVINNGTVARSLQISEIEVFSPNVMTGLYSTAPAGNTTDNAPLYNTSRDMALTAAGASILSSTVTTPNGHGVATSVIDGEEEIGGTTFNTGTLVGSQITVNLGGTAGANKAIGTIRVHERNDGCCQDRLSDFTVNIYADNGSGGLGALVATQSFPGQAPTNSFAEFVITPAITLNNNVRVTAASRINVTGTGARPIFKNLTFDGAHELDLDSAGQEIVFSGTTLFNAAGTLRADTANVYLGGVVQDVAAAGFIKTGAGTVTLAGANTYSGDTSINEGLVRLFNNSALGNETGKTVIAPGATLDIYGFRAGTNGNELVEVSGTGVGGNGAINNTGPSQTNAFRRLTLLGDTTVRTDNRWDVRNTGGTATFDMNGKTLTKVGAGDLALVNATVEDEGNVNVNQNVFRIEGTTDYDGPTSTISVVAGATLDFYSDTNTHDVNVTLASGANLTGSAGSSVATGSTIAGTVTLSSGTANINPGNNSLAISGKVTGAGAFTKGGANTLVLSNPTNDYSGATTVSAGTLSITAASALGAITAGTTVSGGATLRLDPTAATTFAAEPLTLSGTLLNNAQANIWSSAITVPAQALATLNANTGTSLTLGSTVTLTQADTLTKAGAGDVILAGNNTGLSGWLQVNAGRLIAANAGALGSNANTGTVVLPGATLGVQGGVSVAAEATILNGTGVGGLGALVNVSGNNTYSGAITLGSATTIASAVANDLLTLSGSVTANFGLTVAGAGNVTISGVLTGSTGFLPGIMETHLVGSFDTGTAVTGGRIVANPRLGETNVVPPWGNNETWVYTGQLYDGDGTFVLAENIDDNTRVLIDGVNRLQNGAWNVITTTAAVLGATTTNYAVASANPNGGTTAFGAGPNSDNWHNLEIRFGNGTGGAGAVTDATNSWTTSKAFAYSSTVPAGNALYMGTNYIIPTGGTAAVDGNLRVAVSNSLTKTGAGTLTLSNAANTYTGTTTVTGGTLTLLGATNNNIGNSPTIQLNSGTQLNVVGLSGSTFSLASTQTLSGSGILTGDLSGTGVIAPKSDAGAIGMLTVTGNLTYSGSIDLDVNAPYTTAGTDYDQLVVQGGTLNLTGATTNTTGTATAPIAGQVVTLINKTSAGTTTDGANPSDGAVVASPGSNSFRLFYNGGDGNDVVLASTVIAAGGTIYVNDDWNTLGSVDGNLETVAVETAYFGIDAFASVQDALNANPNFTGIIVVNGGVYTTPTNLDLNGAGAVELRLVQDLTPGNNELDVEMANLTGSANDAVKIRFGAANANLTLDQGNFPGTISGAGSLTKTTAGTLTLSGTNTSFTGGIVVTAGTLNFSANAHLGANANSVTLQGGTLSSTPTTGTISFTHPIIVDPLGGTLNVNGALTAGKLFLTGGANQISGSGQFTKTGGGVLQINQPQSLSGPFIVKGLIEAQNVNALGNASATNIVTIDGGEVVASNITVPHKLIVKNNGTLSANSATAGFSGTIDAQGDFFVRPRNFQDTSNPGRSITLSNAITGAGAMKVDSTGATSAGTVIVSSASNTFSGGVQIIYGNVKLGVTNALPANTSVSFGARTTGGTLDLAGFNQQVSTLTVAGAPIRQLIGNSSTANNSTLTVTGNTNFSGTIVDTLLTGNKTVALVVNGGSVTLSGSNRYSGGSTIMSGTLTGTAPGTLGTGPVTEQNNTTLVVNPAVSTVTGFGVNGAGWTLNGGATVASDVLTLTTTSTSQARSAYYSQVVPTAAFTASFIYNNPTTSPGADGFTFVLEGDARGNTAVGDSGGALGIGGTNVVSPSVGLAFNNYAGTTNVKGFKFFANGAVGNPYTSPAPVVASNGQPITVNVSYDGTTLTWTLVQGANTSTFSQAVDIPTAIGARAFIGFTGGTGGETSLQTISNFSYATTTPVAVYSNSVIVAAGANANLQVGATASSPTLTMGNLSLGSGSTLNVSAASTTPANLAYGLNLGATSLSGTNTLSVANNGSGTGTVTLGALGDSGTAATLTKAGAGTLVLGAAASSLVNGTAVNVSAGTLNSNNATALGTLASVTLAASTTLNLGASQQLGALNSSAGTALTNLNGNTLTIGSTNNLASSYAGVLANGTGVGSLIKAGANVALLSGVNTYSGATTVNAGTLQLGNAAALGTTAAGTSVSSGAVLDLNGQAIGSEALTLIGTGLSGAGALINSSATAASAAGNVANNTYAVGGTGNITLTGNVQGVLTKVGSNTLTLGGTVDNSGLGATVTSGVLVLAKNPSSSVPDVHAIGGGGLTINGGTAQLGGSGGDQIYNGAGVTIGAAGTFDLNGQSERISTLNGSGTVTNLAAGAVTLTTTGNSTYNGTITNGTGALTLVKTGGALTLTGINSYTGGTIVNGGGLLQINSDAQLGAVPGSPTVNVTLDNGGLKNNNSTPVLNVNRTISLGAGGGWITAGWSKPFTINGQITGAGGLTVNNDSGPVILTNSANDYSGNTTIGGALNGNSGNSATLKLGASNVIPSGLGKGIVVFNGTAGGTATLDVAGFSETINGMSVTGAGASVIDNTTGNGALTIGDNNMSSTFGGLITDSSGTLSLTKIGAGTLTLTNANTYSGSTTVSNGTLLVNNAASATGSGSVAVANGATLGGTGGIAGSVTVNGTLSPGMTAGDAATLAIGGDLSLLAGSSYVVDVLTGVNYDQVSATNITIDPTANLVATAPVGIADGTEIILLDATTSASGMFATGVANSLIPGDRIVVLNGTEIYHLTNGDAVAQRFAGVDATEVALVRNRGMVAEPNSYTMLQNATLNGNVLTDPSANLDVDVDLDQDASVVLVGSAPNVATQGTLTLASDGAFSFTPIANFKGTATFSYKLFDGEKSSNTVLVTINVTNIALDADGNLQVGGTTGADRIVIQPALGGKIAVRFNNVLSSSFALDPGKKVIVYGNAGNDTITVSNVVVPVEFYGGAGNDYLAGGSQNDILDGGSGDDRLLAGAGDDMLFGGAGNDTLSGGLGNDVVYGDSYLDLDGNIVTPTLASQQGRDIISGEAGDDFLYGEGNNDTINGGLGSDLLRGGDGNDTLSGDDGNDTLSGDLGADKLYGRAGNDVLVGGTDADIIYGGLGDDLLFGNVLDDDSDDALEAIYLDWFAGNQADAAQTVKDSFRAAETLTDVLYGEAGTDWYLLYFGDKIATATDKAPANNIETIQPNP